MSNVGATIAAEQMAIAEREEMAGYKYRARPSSHRPGEWSSSEESSEEDFVDLTSDCVSFEDKMNWLEMQREMIIRE